MFDFEVLPLAKPTCARPEKGCLEFFPTESPGPKALLCSFPHDAQDPQGLRALVGTLGFRVNPNASFL